MKKSILNIMLAVAMFAVVSCGQKQDDSREVAEEQNEEKFEDSKLEDDTEFAVAAADAGMAEVQLAQLALTNGSSQQVKQYAQNMITDHTKANEELKAVARQKNITLPTTLSQDKQEKYNQLSEKRGEEFDKEYMDQMVDSHKDVLDKFQKQAENGNDADLKAWAANKVPVLQHHLEMAQTAQDAMKK